MKSPRKCKRKYEKHIVYTGFVKLHSVSGDHGNARFYNGFLTSLVFLRSRCQPMTVPRPCRDRATGCGTGYGRGPFVARSGHGHGLGPLHFFWQIFSLHRRGNGGTLKYRTVSHSPDRATTVPRPRHDRASGLAPLESQKPRGRAKVSVVAGHVYGRALGILIVSLFNTKPLCIEKRND